MKIDKKTLNDLAQEVQISQMKVFLNKKTLESVAVPNADLMMGYDSEEWEEEIATIESNPDDYIYFPTMGSDNSFKIMENFTNEVVAVAAVKDKLLAILSCSRPFRNFKDMVEDSAYREKWFAYRDAQYEEYIKEILQKEGFM